MTGQTTWARMTKLLRLIFNSCLEHSLTRRDEHLYRVPLDKLAFLMVCFLNMQSANNQFHNGLEGEPILVVQLLTSCQLYGLVVEVNNLCNQKYFQNHNSTNFEKNTRHNIIFYPKHNARIDGN